MSLLGVGLEIPGFSSGIEWCLDMNNVTWLELLGRTVKIQFS
jgi:hypothetical protein